MSPNAFALAADMVLPPSDTWKPLPHQIEPEGKWFVWLLLGGRGAGKTATAARKMYEHVMGPPCLPGVPGGHWPAIIAPTLGDAVTSCVTGPSGLIQHDKGVKARSKEGGLMAVFSNGCEAKIFGAHEKEDVERLRSGGNRCFVWAEEVAAWRYMNEAWQHMRYGLRVGPWPRVIASTTPKNRTLIKELVNKARLGSKRANGSPEVVLTKASTADNPHLDSDVKQMLYDDYAGTRLGRQELLAEILEDVDGALWTPYDIDFDRLHPSVAPDSYDRIVIAVDPAASAVGDEHGIVVCGRIGKYVDRSQFRHKLPHGFVLADETVRGGPNDWGESAIKAFHDWGGNLVVGEVNNGGDMVGNTIHAIDPTIPFKKVHATRGKAKRAEPVAGLYQQHRVHHVGMFPLMEDQMTGWDANEPPEDWSPDRMDALVWCLHELLIGRTQSTTGNSSDTRLRQTR